MIDILMATYNGENYIEEQIESIIKQSVPNWHLYICDDCSEDNTQAIIEKYSNQFPDKITAIKNSENIGHKATFFKLLTYSKGAYVFTCDQDDVWKSDKIALTLRGFENENPNRPVLVHTDLTVVDEGLQIVSPSMVKAQHIDITRNKPNEIVVQNIVTGCTMAMNKTLVSIIREPKNVPVHDWWIAMVASLFGKIKFVNKSTMYYRQHQSNAVGAKLMSMDYILDRIGNTSNNKKMLYYGYALARECVACYGSSLTIKTKMMLKTYGSMPKKSKLQKFFTIKEYNIWKSGIVRKIGQLLYM